MTTFLDTEAAAEHLGISAKTLRAQAAKGVLPSYKLNPRKMIFDLEDIEAYERDHKGKFGTRSPGHPMNALNPALDAARRWAAAFGTGEQVPFNEGAFKLLCEQVVSPIQSGAALARGRADLGLLVQAFRQFVDQSRPVDGTLPPRTVAIIDLFLHDTLRRIGGEEAQATSINGDEDEATDEAWPTSRRANPS